MDTEKKFPRHVAFIMDGNRRWAKERGLPLFAGHKKGEERIEPLVDAAIELGISHLTFWAFSTENWHRSREEVSFLLSLYRRNLEKKVDSFHRKNVRIIILGNLSLFPDDIQKKTTAWMEKTKKNTGITVNLALSYGGKDEIIRAIKRWEKEKKTQQKDILLTPEKFATYLDTAGQPDPDMLIRTGGEKRLSGFLLWQLEYAELFFPEVFWPDFTPEKFKELLKKYVARNRRFGR